MDVELNPLLKRAEERPEEVKVYFIDGAHFIYGAILGYLWCFVDVLVRSGYGRKRFNVLGALDSHTNEVIIETNNSYINADSVIALLEKLRIKNGETVEINIVLDNAKYQHCEKVKNRAKELNINLVFLPPYSPNLNLIERLWKLLRKELLANNYFDNFNLFCENIENCLNDIHIKHKEKMSSLMTHKFEILGY